MLSVDGQEIPINGSDLIVGKSKKGAAIGMSIGLGLSILPVLGFATGFLIKGVEVCLQQIPVVRTVSEVTIKVK
ncbi:MAG: hypothetical protein IT244_09470 [Bacteroidia bacterium]|nr:hypothetical protein [Bacteroidia bacterium]